jgi:S1-C subfamily serine protease
MAAATYVVRRGEIKMTSPFDGLEVDQPMRPSARAFDFDLEHRLDSVVVLHARVPEDAYTAKTLSTDRLGNGVVIGADGLVLTIGYLITEAEEVTLITNDGRHVPAHPLGYDQASGFGLVHALEPLGLPAAPLGDSRKLGPRDPVILAGGGGVSHAVAGRVIARAPFAGYWEYLLDEALFTAPGHPHWSGAALIGPSGAIIGVGSLQMQQQAPGGQPTLINMSVPIELLPPILDDLSRGRAAQAPRPWLGVYAQDDGDHVVVMDVAADGPAARAEMRAGDVILAVAGEAVASLADFYAALWALGPAGAIAPLRLRRERDVFDVEVRTIDRASKLRRRRFN